MKDIKAKKGNSNEENKISASQLYETPTNLMQYYMIIKYEEKLDNLFSFLKSHQRSKILVFLTTCKQVRFVFSAFKKLKPGLPIMEMHGRQGQSKRMAIYYTFSERKYCCLFTTNLGARGLDFPSIDWVVVVDCPDSEQDYIHKVGRTARFTQSGKSLLMLTQSESKFAEKIKEAGSHLHKLNPNPKRQLTIKKTLQALCSEDQDLKYIAQRAVISYIKSLYYKGDKEVFNFGGFKPKKFSRSYGLIQTPVIKIGGTEINGKSNEIESKVIKREAQDEEDQGLGKRKVNKKIDKLRKRQKKKKNFISKGDEKDEKDEAEHDLQLNDQVYKKNVLHNAKRLRGKPIKSNNLFEKDDDQDDEELFVKKKKPRNVEKIGSNPWKLSKRQMKKIKKDGPFAGKNIKIIESDEEDDHDKPIKGNTKSLYKLSRSYDLIPEEET